MTRYAVLLGSAWKRRGSLTWRVAISLGHVSARSALARRDDCQCPLATPPSLSSIQTCTLTKSHNLDSSTYHYIYSNTCTLQLAKMSNEEEQYDDSSMGGPGAPTPVSALEVGSKSLLVL